MACRCVAYIRARHDTLYPLPVPYTHSTTHRPYYTFSRLITNNWPTYIAILITYIYRYNTSLLISYKSIFITVFITQLRLEDCALRSVLYTRAAVHLGISHAAKSSPRISIRVNGSILFHLLQLITRTVIFSKHSVKQLQIQASSNIARNRSTIGSSPLTSIQLPRTSGALHLQQCPPDSAQRRMHSLQPMIDWQHFASMGLETGPKENTKIYKML